MSGSWRSSIPSGRCARNPNSQPRSPQSPTTSSTPKKRARRPTAIRCSFLHVSRAEIDLPDGTNPYADAVYDRAATNFAVCAQRRWLSRTSRASTSTGCGWAGRSTQTGLAACFSIDEYDRDVIKKHERTRPDKEDDRTRHMLALGAQTGPVFLTYRASADVNAIAGRGDAGQAAVRLHGTRRRAAHAVARRRRRPRRAGRCFRPDSVAVHRGRSSPRRQRGASAPDAAAAPALGDAPSRLSCGGVSRRSGADPAVQPRGERPGRIVARRIPGGVRRGFDMQAGAATPRRAARLRCIWAGSGGRCGRDQAGQAGQPDGRSDWIARRQRAAGSAACADSDIADVRTDKRIDFVGGARGTAALEALVDSGKAAVAFSLPPVGLADLMAVSDAGRDHAAEVHVVRAEASRRSADQPARRIGVVKVLIADNFEQSGIEGLKAAGCEVVVPARPKDDGADCRDSRDGGRRAGRPQHGRHRGDAGSRRAVARRPRRRGLQHHRRRHRVEARHLRVELSRQERHRRRRAGLRADPCARPARARQRRRPARRARGTRRSTRRRAACTAGRSACSATATSARRWRGARTRSAWPSSSGAAASPTGRRRCLDEPVPLQIAAIAAGSGRARDVLSVHLALNADTRGLVDASVLDRLKPGSYFINTARAEVMDSRRAGEGRARERAPRRPRRLRGRTDVRHRRVQRRDRGAAATCTARITSARRPIRRRKRSRPRPSASSRPTRTPARCRTW